MARLLQPAEATQLLKPETVAQRLGVSLATVRKWVFLRRLPVVRVGRAVRVRAEDLEALIRAGYEPLARKRRR